MAYLTLNSATTSTLSIRLTGMSSYTAYQRYVTWFIGKTESGLTKWDTQSINSSGSDVSYRFTGLQDDTEYLVRATVFIEDAPSGNWSTDFDGWFTTEAEEESGTININCTIGTGTIDCTVELTGFSTFHHAAVVLYRKGYKTTEPSDTPNSSQNVYKNPGTVTFTDLPTDNYRIWVFVYTSASGSYVASEAYPSTTRWMSVTAASAPAHWSWTASTPRRNAQTALENKGAVSNFSYTVWNELCEKVLEIRQALGKSWSSYYLTFAKTKMSSTDKTLTAARYNSLRYNVGELYSTGISEVSSGDKVKGQTHFLDLTDTINEWIDNAF